MVDRAQIDRLADKIKEKFKPEKILLFGSYAYGTPDRDSDVDLFVIMNTDLPLSKQTFLIRREFREGFPIDIVVRTPAQVSDRLQMGDFFIKEVMEKGIQL